MGSPPTSSARRIADEAPGGRDHTRSLWSEQAAVSCWPSGDTNTMAKSTPAGTAMRAISFVSSPPALMRVSPRVQHQLARYERSYVVRVACQQDRSHQLATRDQRVAGAGPVWIPVEDGVGGEIELCHQRKVSGRGHQVMNA